MLLEYLGVSNYQELLEMVKNNPTNEKVVELKTILAPLGVQISQHT
ncbi:hypothetical protein SAMN02787081_04697 [Lysinibacillus fusiformis]|uniref:Uncharacterized protein n=1 Tax=Lysinibacillus fusiformis TaxID=28031 RepID=A0A1H9SEN4_9BACI|nr:hypothetical protein [Lysinibacillus fusiformis]SCY83838.1 hypothetical protein SAMN02787081_04697 [Lysinibacillus fusiformis]SEO53540.1 hypothetical protein SAMN02787103_04670 [Lysinibacillus fusiformis]SER83490.1 hypothetical protein SAMN02787113_04702 [Lysinibacillus fusiformis]